MQSRKKRKNTILDNSTTSANWVQNLTKLDYTMFLNWKIGNSFDAAIGLVTGARTKAEDAVKLDTENRINETNAQMNNRTIKEYEFYDTNDEYL